MTASREPREVAAQDVRTSSGHTGQAAAAHSPPPSVVAPAPAGTGPSESPDASAKASPEEDAPQEVIRRTFHGYVAGAISSFVVVVLGLPIVGYLAAPLAAGAKAAWVSLGRADAFKPGEPTLVSLTVARQDGWRQVTEARTAWVTAQGNNQFVAYNGRCTHLGCAYSWRTEGEHAKRFFCPCHEGEYDLSGTVVAGPPPRPLDRLEVKVDSGEVLALYQDFRLGVPEREPV
jgi:menaquinol-cytochrome c reductase iron-sulfur subunit